jgi:hypothetical protein
LETLARDLVVYGTILHDQFRRDRDTGEPDTFAARYTE